MIRLGCIRVSRALGGWLLALSILLGGNTLAATTAEVTDPDRQVPFALAVRGGVSLGAYESGFEWALLRYLKDARSGNRSAEQSYVDLLATSGASAGSINALMSTLSWCVDPAKASSAELFPDAVSDNLLFDTWLSIGFEELLPEKVDSFKHYRADDGVLTRNAFRATVNRLRNLLETDSFIPGCEVRFGVLVTRVDPAERVYAGIRVKNQRFVIPLRLRVDPQGYARFMGCRVDDEDPAFGNIMYLQGTPTLDPECPLVHDTDAIVDAIEASSAFPIAFGRKFIRYCEPVADVAEPVVDEFGRCPEGMKPVIDEFIDGGLFDNIPLGVAKALAEPGMWDSADELSYERSGRRFNYIYLDPTIRRYEAANGEPELQETKATIDQDEAAANDATYGLRSQMRFFFGAITSGRDYELYNLLRSGEWTNQVYAISGTLSDTINARYPDLETVKPQLEGLQMMLPQCEQWFEGNLRPIDVPDRDAVATAHQCIVTGVYVLEQQYRGTPVGEALRGCEELTRQRNLLLDWIAALAGYLGEDKLVMNAELTRNDKLGDRRILLSTRFSPVVGEMMSAFGAFVDREFAEYDYYAGVYDAVFGIANFVCERQLERQACTAAQLHRIYLALGIANSPPADTVFRYLLRREHGTAENFDAGHGWVNAEFTPDANMLAIANSLFGDERADGEPGNTAPTMTEFISRLVEQDYDASDSSDFLKRIFRLKDKDELTWYYPLTLRASNRLLLLEHRESEVLEGGQFLTAGLALGAFYLHSYMREEEITLNVSTAPDWSWQSWLPDEIAIDARNGGLDLSWYQGRQMTESGWRWDVKLTPIQMMDWGEVRSEDVWFSQADFVISRRTHGVFSAFGLGPSVFYTWDTWPNATQTTYGAMAYLGFIEDKFRVTIGTASFSNEFAGPTYYLNFGVNDVPGLAYWGWSGSRRSWWPFRKDDEDDE
jgi:hypothetical protein